MVAAADLPDNLAAFVRGQDVVASAYDAAHRHADDIGIGRTRNYDEAIGSCVDGDELNLRSFSVDYSISCSEDSARIDGRSAAQ